MIYKGKSRAEVNAHSINLIIFWRTPFFVRTQTLGMDPTHIFRNEAPEF